MTAFSGRTLFQMRNFGTFFRVPVLCSKNRDTAKTLVQLPPKPKRPPNSFMKFSCEKRESILEKEPNLKSSDVQRHAAKLWAALSESEKYIYKMKYLEEMKNYREQMKEYELSESNEDYMLEMKASKMKTTKAQKILEGRPRKPASAFFIFRKEFMNNEGKGLSPLEVAPILKKKWLELDDSEKKKYIESFRKMNEIYQTELLEWEEKMIENGQYHLVRVKTSKSKSKEDKIKLSLN